MVYSSQKSHSGHLDSATIGGQYDGIIWLVLCFIKSINYRNRFATQYITYLNIWGALSRNVSSLSTHDRLVGWQWGKIPLKPSPYIQVSDVLCYKPILIIDRTSLLQNSLKVIKSINVDFLDQFCYFSIKYLAIILRRMGESQ